MLPIQKIAKRNDLIQVTAGDNIQNSYAITVEDLMSSMSRLEASEKEAEASMVVKVKVPEKSWRNSKIEKWLDKNKVPYDDEDVKDVMLKKASAWLEKQHV